MRAEDLLPTALLLGAFVLAAGLYGFLLALAEVLARPRLRGAAYVSYLLELIIALAILVSTPLEPWWKLFIAACALAYFFIPRITLRHLARIHSEDNLDASKPGRRPARFMAGLGRST